MKSQDIVILLKLISLEQKREQGTAHLGQHLHGEDPFSVRGLKAALGINETEVNASIKRSLSRDWRSKTGNPAKQLPIAVTSTISSSSD